ncbi:MAG TPA: hypothetical protein VD790_10425 [Thermoleophilaceae bacterium]|nr:hypothetical protein [Thermoleophilaceae bacterium]
MNTAGTGLAKVALITLMAVGSIFLWIGIPVGWLWIGSQLQSDSGQASFGLYMGVLLGIVVSMVVVGKILHRLNGVYGRLTGSEVVRVRLPWHRSLRGESEGRAQQQILDVVMVASVMSAGFVFLVWFLFFAGSSLPGA